LHEGLAAAARIDPSEKHRSPTDKTNRKDFRSSGSKIANRGCGSFTKRIALTRFAEKIAFNPGRRRKRLQAARRESIQPVQLACNGTSTAALSEAPRHAPTFSAFTLAPRRAGHRADCPGYVIRSC